MILETLYILFKSNTDDVEKGTKQAKKKTDELNSALIGTSEAGQKVGEVFFEVASYFGKIAAAAVSIGSLVGALKDAVQYTSNLDLSSRSIGIDVQSIDEWGNALRRTGGDAKSFEQNIRNLSQHTGGDPTVALKFLPALAESLRSLSYVQAINFGQAFGLDLPMITLLRQGNTEIQKLIERQKYLGVVTKEDQIAARNFNFAMQDTAHALRNLFISVGTDVLPALTGLLNHLIPVIVYLRQHSNILVGGLVAVGVIVAELLAPLIAVNAELIFMAVAVGGVVASFGVLYDNLEAFKSGTDSFLSRATERWPVLGRVIDGVIWTNAESFKFLEAVGKRAFHGITETVHYLRTELETMLNIAERIYELFGGNAGFKGTITAAKNQLDVASVSTISSQTSSSIFNSRLGGDKNVKLDIQQITVNAPNSDSESIVETLRRELTRHINDAINYFDNPVVK